MREFDDAVLECFLDNQCQLFPKNVAETLDEAEDFLEECMAVVVDSVDEVIEYFEDEGIDIEGGQLFLGVFGLPKRDKSIYPKYLGIRCGCFRPA